MNAVRCFLLLLWAGVVSVLQGQTIPEGNAVEVVMYALPEALWQAEFEGQFHENPALRKRLEEEAVAGRVTKPVNSRLRPSTEAPAVDQTGEERDFVTGWHGQEKERMEPEGKTLRFIGTKVEVEDGGLTEDGKLLVTMKLEHHLAPPVMYRINYANAATGAERERLSVEYPQFEKLEWQGSLSIWHHWRLAANVLRPAGEEPGGVPAMRYLIFIKRA